MNTFIAAIGASSLLAGIATAATINVPADYSTIQEAIDAAVDGDEIIVAEGTYTGTGSAVAAIDGKLISLTAFNPSPNATIIDGEGERRGITCITAGSSGSSIEGFTIVGGDAENGGGMLVQSCQASINSCFFLDNSADQNGGGFYGYFADIQMENCQFTQNTSNDSGGGLSISYSSIEIGFSDFNQNTATTLGGGVHSFNGQIVLNNCELNDNHSSSGGGAMMLSSQPTINGCQIRDNTADSGAGIRFIGFDPTFVTDCRVSNNVATEAGGGFESSNANPLLWGTVICGNSPQNISGSWIDDGDNCTIAFSCDDDDQNGYPNECGTVADGLHFVPSEFPTIQDAVMAAGIGDSILVGPGTYTGNGDFVISLNGKALTIQALSGADVTILDGENERNVITLAAGESEATIIDGFTITRGFALSGAGIYCLSSSPTIRNCHFVDNLSSDFGGGFYSRNGSPSISNCSFESNVAQDNGGGLYLTGGNPSITDCTMTSNGCNGNGGGLALIACSAAMSNCTVDRNACFDNGGGLDCSNSNATIESCSFSENVTFGSGGGIHTEGGSSIFISCHVDGNISGLGGGLNSISGNCSFEDCTFNMNEAESGGGINLQSGSYAFTNCLFNGNEVDGSQAKGGGARLQYAMVDFSGSTFADNTSSFTGGGLLIFNGGLSMSDCVVSGNQAEIGGGLHSSQAQLGLSGTSFSSNEAEVEGGGLYCSQTEMNASTLRINENMVEGDGGGLYLVNSSGVIDQCLVHDNMATGAFSDGGGIHFYASSPVISNCTIWNNSSADRGGAMFCRINGSPEVMNCTLANNSAVEGGGLYSQTSNPAFGGSTLCGNTPENIIGDWSDLDGNVIEDECVSDCPGDVDRNRVVDVNDLLLMVAAWNTYSYAADFDGDGIVDTDDILLLLENYGQECP